MSATVSLTMEAVEEAVRTHLVKTLGEVRVESDPFSHAYIESAFPPDLYPAILDALPDTALYTPDNPRKYGKPAAMRRQRSRASSLVEGLLHVSSSRYTLPLNASGLARLPDNLRVMWAGVAAALTSQELKAQIFDRFATDLSKRLRTDRAGLERVEAHPRPTLIRDLSGYWIAPHPDTRAKIVTVQLYLARDRSQRDLGTALYRRHLFNPRNLLSLKNMFEKVRQMPFLPNSGYAFPVGRHSWHGREEIPDAGGERNSILLFYYRDASREW
jgi:hypothetical protein